MKKVTLIALFLGTCLCTMSAQTADSKPLTTVSTSLKDYCGVYKMAENPYISEVKIEVKDGKLMSKTPDDEEVVFEHSEDDSFFIPTINATVTFIREKGVINGVVNGVKVVAQGKEMMGSKEK